VLFPDGHHHAQALQAALQLLCDRLARRRDKRLGGKQPTQPHAAPPELRHAVGAELLQLRDALAEVHQPHTDGHVRHVEKALPIRRDDA
jgi:hypothetical protein